MSESHCPIQVATERCYSLLEDSTTFADRYLSHSTKAGDISQFLSCDPFAESTLNTLDETITQLISTAHHEVAQRKRGNITAKLPNLESHGVPWIGRFPVGFGLLGELCAESIHTMSSALRRTFDSVVNTLQSKEKPTANQYP